MSKKRLLSSDSKNNHDPYELENERIMHLFQEAEGCDDLSSGSERPERSSNDESERNNDSEYDAVLESDVEGDPFSDPDGEYGSDSNYNPEGETRSTTSATSDEAEPIQQHKKKTLLKRDQSYRLSDTSKEQEQSYTADSRNLALPNPETQIQQSHGPSSDEQQDKADDDQLYAACESQVSSSAEIELAAHDCENRIQEPTNCIPSDLEQESTSYSGQARSTRRDNSPIFESNQEWEDTYDSIPEFNFNLGNVGPTVVVNQTTLPMDIVNYFIDSNLIEYIVTCINRYGEALCNTNRPHTRGSRRHTFKPVTSEELKKFLGLCILQSHIETPNIRKLFTFTDSLYYHPLFTYTMSGRRFEQILRCFCVYAAKEKRMDKVKDFVAMMITKFQEAYKPDRELSLDESMMLFRGRLSFRQYIKSKKAKYGIKFYILTTHDGYILNFKIYEGKSTLDEDVGGSKVEKLVMHLMTPYLDKGHELYMDNFYNSVTLSKKLLDRRTHITGTLRKDRKHNPRELLNKKLKKGDHLWKRNGKVYVSIWKDKRPVPMITTKHHPRIITSYNRYGKERQKPVEIVEYNKYMSGIDKADQMMSYYSTPKKSVRWHKKVVFRILDMAIWNAFYIYKKYCNQNAHLLHFREDIIKTYIGINNIDLKCHDMVTRCNKNNNRVKIQFGVSDSNSQLGPARALATSSSPTQNSHWPEPIPTPPNSKRNKVFLSCRQCTKNKLRKQTCYRCMGCPEKVPLCPGCFASYHANDYYNE